MRLALLQLLSRAVTRAAVAACVLSAASLAAGCQSSRPSFVFQPVLGASSVVQPVADTATWVEPAAVTAITAAPTPTHKYRVLRRAAVPMSARAALQVTTAARHAPAAAAGRVSVAAPQAPAEVGLGTTVLGVLGLVALPVGLIGLVLGGGLAWGVVAALGAVAVLVAYLDPNGRQ